VNAIIAFWLSRAERVPDIDFGRSLAEFLD